MIDDPSSNWNNFIIKDTDLILNNIFTYVTDETLQNGTVDYIMQTLKDVYIDEARENYEDYTALQNSIQMQKIFSIHKKLKTEQNNTSFLSVNDYYNALITHLYTPEERKIRKKSQTLKLQK